MSKRIPSRWKVKSPFDPAKGLVRMSWNKLNVFTLATKKQIDVSRRSVFQQKWAAKRELRAYHVPNITESQLLLRHWKSQLPLRQLTAKETENLPPVQALAFGELERRLDVVVFRSHFASSIFEARTAVVQGHVKVNGEKCPYPARRLHPGDMITINPKVVPTLIPKKAEAAAEATEEAVDGASETVASPDASKTEEAKSETSESAAAVSKESSEPTGEPTPEVSAAPDAEPAKATEEAKPSKISQTEILAAKHPNSLRFNALPFMAPWMFTPAYLEVCYNTCSTILLRTPLPQPGAVEIPSPHAPDMHALVYEWYSSIKRSKTKRPPAAEPLVVNGQSVRLKTKFDSIVRARLKDERDVKSKLWAEKDEEERVKAFESKVERAASTSASL
ncbi:hypothetical protein CcCBS67573_g08403 [Chytriomyces confervae]|uniref:RNA-binding S4 domain-containing protein n=1 Tax=Chytriomyces confervae TaxID=246404 RepID=A0A507EMG2_9FUNG|nr:hypothetical protein CcCBS67573_g08403 [Chytriomyces confervae]